MSNRFLFIVIAMLAANCAGLTHAAPIQPGKSRAGFYKVRQQDGVWWLIDPNGKKFYSVGVCSIQPVGDDAPALGYAPYNRNIKAKYGSEEAWATETEKRLKMWGFNSRGAWSTQPKSLPEFINLDFSSGHWQKGTLPDYFSPQFAQTVDETAKARTRPTDHNLIGYFTDNELQWETDWRFGPSMFDLYTALPQSADGKSQQKAFLQQRYATPADMAKVWSPAISTWEEYDSLTKLKAVDEVKAQHDRTEWTLKVARHYFEVTTSAIRKYDPNHLIAGCRMTSWTVPEVVVQACGEYCDIISINHYELGPLGSFAYAAMRPSVKTLAVDLSFKEFYRAGKKPLLITEFGFRADDSGLPNSHPDPKLVQPTVPNQKAKGEKYAQWVTTWAKTPYFVGCHWFKYMDEPKEGRFDGENGNYGLADIEDAPYTPFVSLVTKANKQLVTLHTPPATKMPAKVLPKPKEKR
ncbi:MAG: beta-galactosidase [Armatimonadota bacterium]